MIVIEGPDRNLLRLSQSVQEAGADGPLSGWPFWARLLNAGRRLTAIGGSDEHTAEETSDRAVGAPATVVYAQELSEPALLQGLKKGRVYIRIGGTAGPSLEFQARSKGLVWQMGDEVPKSTDDLTVRQNVSRRR